MVKVKKLDEDEVKKNIVHFKVSNKQLKEIQAILSISDCISLSELCRTSIFYYGNAIKEGAVE